MKHPGGRPSDYTPEIIEQAWEYARGGWENAGDKVPSIAGLACEIGVHRETIRLWAKSVDNQFFGIVSAIMESQERKLMNNGLDGSFNASITKLMLTKHGYSDRIEQDNTSSDGSMTPKGIPDDLRSALDSIARQIASGNKPD